MSKRAYEREVANDIKRKLVCAVKKKNLEFTLVDLPIPVQGNIIETDNSIEYLESLDKTEESSSTPQIQHYSTEYLQSLLKTEESSSTPQIQHYSTEYLQSGIIPFTSTLKPRHVKIMPPDKPTPILSQPCPLKYVVVEKKEWDELKQAIGDIKRDQKILLKEFIHLRDNNLKITHKITRNHASDLLLPFHNLDKFKLFDESLLEASEDVKIELIDIFMKQSGTELKKFLYATCKILFTEELASKFTFDGRQANIGFKDLNVSKIIKNCALDKFPFVREDDINKILRRFFYTTKDNISKKPKKRNNIVQLLRTPNCSMTSSS